MLSPLTAQNARAPAVHSRSLAVHDPAATAQAAASWTASTKSASWAAPIPVR